MRKVFQIASFASLLVLMVAIGVAAVSSNPTVAHGDASDDTMLSTMDSTPEMESTASPAMDGEAMSVQAPNGAFPRGVCTLSCLPCFSNSDCQVGEGCQRMCF